MAARRAADVFSWVSMPATAALLRELAEQRIRSHTRRARSSRQSDDPPRPMSTARPHDLTGFLLQPVAGIGTRPASRPIRKIFFPERGGSSKATRSYCARCPVTEECLTYALDKLEEWFGAEATYRG